MYVSLSQLKARLVLRPKTNRVDAAGNVKYFDSLLTSKKKLIANFKALMCHNNSTCNTLDHKYHRPCGLNLNEIIRSRLLKAWLVLM